MKRLLLFTAFFALCLPALGTFHTGYFNDDARHVLAARSLLHGHYRDLSDPLQNPIINQLPGYPLLLAMTGANETAGKLLSCAFHAGSAALLFSFAGPASAGAALLLALHPFAITMSGTLMTEPAFLLATVISLILLARGRLFAALMCAAFSGWIRPEGFLLLSAITACRIKNLPVKDRLMLSIPFLFWALPFIRNMVVSSTPAGYMSELAGTSAAVNALSNALYYFHAVPLVSVGIYYGGGAVQGWMTALCAVFWLALGAGLTTLLQKDESRERALYLILSLCAHLLWVNHTPRYILPLIPFILEAVLYGLALQKEHGRKLAVSFAAAALALMLFQDWGVLRAGLSSGDSRKHIPGAILWLKTNTPANAVVMAKYREKTFYISGRKTIGYYYNPDISSWIKTLDDNGVDYLLLDDSAGVVEVTPQREAGRRKAFATIAAFAADRRYFLPVYSDKAGLVAKRIK